VSAGFRLYLYLFGGNPVFGVLGGALVVLVWLYVLNLALLVGAELNAVLVQRRAASAPPSTEPSLAPASSPASTPTTGVPP
jgi:membrane protein